MNEVPMNETLFNLFSFNGNMKAFGIAKLLQDPLTDPHFFLQQITKIEPLLAYFDPSDSFMVFDDIMDNTEFIRFLMTEADWVVDAGNGWIELLDSDGSINRFEKIVK